ncbi:hypothetical protein IFM89_000401 [Coptis chinensis]|uniref:Mitochondrial inner membrane protease ATP23 n=1 Tax=Coptis chinensis TaxID=261450 RepID=A0A835HEP1_9MAGN|nr:hypothetical protein IFM89_000401 [Coptis chinensis]
MEEEAMGSESFFSNANRGKTIEECQEMIQTSFTIPMVKFLREHLDKSGCYMGNNFIKAVNCEKEVAGGYVRGKGIIVCSNHMNIQDEVNQVVIHELIHAYDDCRAKNLDWTNCAHHACSEIRAGHLSGDCHYKRELLRGFMKLRGQEQVSSGSSETQVNKKYSFIMLVMECVRRRVLMSLKGNPNCSEAAAKDATDTVWDVCYNDTKPFDRAP